MVSHRGYFAKFLLASVMLTVLTAALTLYLYGPFRHSSFGLVDDHEILRFLGKNHRVTFDQIPHILITQTEVGNWGHSARYRPVYYLLRIIEAMLEGDHAGRWYLLRMGIIVSAAAGTAVLALRVTFARGSGWIRFLIAGALALVVAVLVVTLPPWQDIATRLGPSEAYVAFGLTVFAAGASIVFTAPHRTYAWILLTGGFVIAVGSKEDCLLLLLPLLAIYVLRFPGAASKPVVLALGILETLFAAFIAIGVALGISSTGGDVYGDQRSFGLFLSTIPDNFFLFASLAALLTALLVEMRHVQPTKTSSRSGPLKLVTNYFSFRPRTLVAAGSVYLVVGEAYFYQNSYRGADFAAGRYGYVTEIVTVFAITAAISALFLMTYARAFATVAVLVGGVVIVASSPVGNQIPIALQTDRAKANASVDVLRANFAQIEAGVADLRKNTPAQALFIVDNAYDYEPVYSVPQFLSYYGAVDGIFVSMQMKGSIDNAPGSLQNPSLEADLTRMSKRGNTTDNWRVLPNRSLKTDQRIVCFYVDSQPLDTSFCDSVYRVG